jgi:hypothetical protein
MSRGDIGFKFSVGEIFEAVVGRGSLGVDFSVEYGSVGGNVGAPDRAN